MLLRPTWAAPTAATLLLITTLLPLAAHAGRAQVGIGMGTWANTDLDGASASGQSWRDGAPLQTASDAAAPPAKDWATARWHCSGAAAWRRTQAPRAKVSPAAIRMPSCGRPSRWSMRSTGRRRSTRC